MAVRYPILDGVFASDGHTNLTGARKAQVLVGDFGAQGFDYLGNSAQDRAVWKMANNAYLVTSKRIDQKLPSWARNTEFSQVLREDSPPSWWSWVRELRLHQSVKNLLLFLPLIAAHEFEDFGTLLHVAAGFVVFSLMASAVYLLNDLIDLPSDRQHARKAFRPIAAGNILPMHAFLVSTVLAVAAIVGAFAIDIRFALVLLLYAALTIIYSFWLKRVPLIDVILLALLYMIRILAGAVVASIALSFWFTSVTLFLFISLALVKRYSELNRHTAQHPDEHLPGRGYRAVDTTVVLTLGVSSGMAVLLLLAIYLQSDAVAALYPSRDLLWLVIPAMFYWIGNIWLQAGRGVVHDDPIVFALRNPASLISAILIALLFIAASTTIQSFVEQIYALAS